LSAEVLATAKLNLSLEVLAKTPDGFHELRSSMIALALGDQLRAEVCEDAGVTLSLSGEFSAGVPTDDSNLAVRAVSALLERSEHSGGVSLALEKRVPAGAGLGGGSADAAAALVAARVVLGLGEDAEMDESILGALGSDTVFFHAASTGHALCEGRGERVTERDEVGDWSILLVTPAVHASTAAVFAAYELSGELRAQESAPDFSKMTVREARLELSNGLEASALALYPELSEWRKVLDSAGLSHAHLTGSGASFFALFEERGEAQEALKQLLSEAAGLPQPSLACVTSPAHGVSKRL
jgi:4-diphosphocytidyl-2-C-methyl-D-erythritol kinase